MRHLTVVLAALCIVFGLSGRGDSAFSPILPVHTVATTTYTFSLNDCGVQYSSVYFTSSSAVTATVPNTLPPGCILNIFQGGTGQVGFAGGGGTITPVNSHSYTKTYGQNAGVSVQVITSSSAIMVGDGM